MDSLKRNAETELQCGTDREPTAGIWKIPWEGDALLSSAPPGYETVSE